MFNRKKWLKFRINIFDRIGKMIQRNLIEKYIIWIELINYFQHQYFKSIFNEMLKKKFSKPQLCDNYPCHQILLMLKSKILIKIGNFYLK